MIPAKNAKIEAKNKRAKNPFIEITPYITHQGLDPSERNWLT